MASFRSMMKKCSRCPEIKALIDFYSVSNKPGTARPECKKCTNISNSKAQQENKVRRNIYKAAWLRGNPGAHNAWVKNNKGLVASYNAKRRAAKKLRTARWLTLDQQQEIRQFYKDAEYLTLYTKVPFEVDHIIPLKGKNISGLHVPNNLQLLTAEENNKKNNKWNIS